MQESTIHTCMYKLDKWLTHLGHYMNTWQT